MRGKKAEETVLAARSIIEEVSDETPADNAAAPTGSPASDDETTPTATGEALVEVDRLVRRFGPFTAVDGIGFTVRRGEVLGFLGPNGAGKSTTMKMLTGYLTPNEGTARIAGFDVRRQPLAAQRTLGYLPEGAPAWPEMTALGFLRFIAKVRGLKGADAKAAVDRAIAATELESVLHQPIDTLSKGFRRRVGLAQAVLHDPPVLIMDEPTDGLDPNQKFEVRRLIGEMAPDKAIIISTHILEEVDAICTRAIVIDRGHLVADGTPADLARHSAYHNAVSLTVASEAATAVRRDLANLAGVTRIDVTRRGPDTTFTLLQTPAGADGALRDSDTALIDEVSRLARERQWPVRALYTEAGRLDEVFRNLTRGDGARASSAKE